MKRMLAWLPLLLALWTLPLWALAEGDDAPDQGAADSAAAEADDSAPVNAGGYQKYNADGYGFSLSLPKNGDVANSQTANWQEEPEVAFEWTNNDAPVVLITARVDTMDVELNDERFKVLCDTMLDTWKADTENIKIESSQSNLTINNNKWNLIELSDSSNKDGTVYFSVFTTYRGSKVYTVSMYYLHSVDRVVRDFGKPVLQNFTIQ